MLKHEILRAVKNKFFYISIILSVIIGCAGLISYYSDIHFHIMVGNGQAVSSYEAWLYCLSLGSGTIYRLIVPLLVSIPFTDSYLKDKKSGYINYIIARCSFNYYFLSKVIANALVGGLTVVIPLFVWLGITSFLFPNSLPNTNLNFKPGGPFGNLYPEQPLIYISFLIFMGFLFGIAYSTLGLSISAVVNNKFAVVCFPFIFYLILTLSSQILKIKFLFPIALIVPYELMGVNFRMLILGFSFTFAVAGILIIKIVIKNQGDLI